MLKEIPVLNRPFCARLNIPGAKSITYRALTIAALAEGVSELSQIFLSAGTKSFIQALSQLGIVTQLDEKNCSCIIAGGSGQFPKKHANIWCDESLTMVKFLLSACSSTQGVYYFDGTKHLRDINLTELLNILAIKGAQFIPTDSSHLPFTLVGADTLEGGELVLKNKTFNKIISAILIIAPYARTPFIITAENSIHTHLVDQTCSMMAEFGVLVHHVHRGQIMIPVPQRYQARDYVIEPDFALAAYFFAGAMINHGELNIPAPRRLYIKQNEISFLSILERIGAEISETSLGLTLKAPNEYKGLEIEVYDLSTLFLCSLILAPFASSPSIFIIPNDLQPREEKRLKWVCYYLDKMSIPYDKKIRTIKIFPCSPRATIINAKDDYKIAMAFCLMALKVPNMRIENAEYILQKYPTFFDLLEAINKSLVHHLT